MTRFTLFRDRLDRRLRMLPLRPATGGDGSANLDLLYAELTERDVSTMPNSSRT